MKKEKLRIVLTGGHAATTALAVIQELTTSHPRWDLYFIGSKYAIEGKKAFTLEYEILPKFDVKFIPLNSGRLQRKFTFYTIPSLLKIPIGFIQALVHLVSIKPKIILSFGGFAAFPVVLVGKMLGIPIIIHEQTAAAGRANLATYKFASKVALSRNSSVQYFKDSNYKIVGNPTVKEILNVKKKLSLSYPPVIFITGGSRGSKNINDVIEKTLPFLLTKYKVIHLTGELDYQRFEKIRSNLTGSGLRNYEVYSRIMPMEMAKFYARADLVVARAGANTVSEIVSTKRPSILIPLPISYLDEQAKNAEYASDLGIAKVVPQKNISQKILIREIDMMANKFNEIVRNANYENPDVNASKRLVVVLEESLK